MRRFDEALAYTLDAEQAFKALNAPLIKHAFVTLELGLLTKSQGQWEDAEQYLSYSVSLWREVGEPVYLANCLRLLGQVLVTQDKIDEALAVYHEALATLAGTENHLEKTRMFNDLGSLHWKQGNLDEAEQCFLKANSPLLRQSSDLIVQALVLSNLGTIYLAQGKLSEAQCSFQQSIAFGKNCDDKVQLANSLGGLAEVKVAKGERAEARVLYAEAQNFLRLYPQDAWGQKLQKEFSAAMHDLA
jgi:tetratricopeptide (TPR) repeat protein